MDVIAIFDIGKTNKKILLFDQNLSVVYQEEVRFDEITDDDGFMGDDIVLLENWVKSTLLKFTGIDKYNIKAVNFSTYGASLIYLDNEGKRLTPLYNYLKNMPSYIPNEIYFKNGGEDEFARKTASPTLGFLNSGLQIKWLQRTKPKMCKEVKEILHFPQYLSYMFTNKIVSEYTSIGCHTAMWDFDKMQYHSWLNKFDVEFPNPISSSTTFDGNLGDEIVKFGIGIHDSSSSLVPYLHANEKEFILVSTGTWSIAMNPFNKEILTQDQLKDDCLCFLSVKQEQVKSSRLYMGFIHEINAKHLSAYFGESDDNFKNVKFSAKVISKLNAKFGEGRVFFKKGIPDNFLDEMVDLSQFENYIEAYHQLMIDLTFYSIKSIENVIPQNDKSDKIIVTGGFAKNDIYIRLLADYFFNKRIVISEIDNSSALGAAVVIWDEVYSDSVLNLDLGLKLWEERVIMDKAK